MTLTYVKFCYNFIFISHYILSLALGPVTPHFHFDPLPLGDGRISMNDPVIFAQSLEDMGEEMVSTSQIKSQVKRNGGPIYRFFGKPAMQTRWMAGTPHKSG